MLSITFLGWTRGSTKAFVNQKELSYSNHSHTLDSLSGILSVTKGGTGVESLDELKSALGVSSVGIKSIIYGASLNIKYGSQITLYTGTNISGALLIGSLYNSNTTLASEGSIIPAFFPSSNTNYRYIRCINQSNSIQNDNNIKFKCTTTTLVVTSNSGGNLYDYFILIV